VTTPAAAAGLMALACERIGERQCTAVCNHIEDSVTTWHSRNAPQWDSTIAVIGGGCGCSFWRNFCLSPWSAGHLVVGGPASVTAGGASCGPQRLAPEMSLTFGWHSWEG